MTSRIRSRIEYLAPADNIPVLLLHWSLIIKFLASSAGFQQGFMKHWLTFFGRKGAVATLYINYEINPVRTECAEANSRRLDRWQACWDRVPETPAQLPQWRSPSPWKPGTEVDCCSDPGWSQWCWSSSTPVSSGRWTSQTPTNNIQITISDNNDQARSQDCKFGGQLQCLGGGTDIFRVLLYCYSRLAMSTVSVTEHTNIVVIK